MPELPNDYLMIICLQRSVQSFLVRLDFVPVFGTWLQTAHFGTVGRGDARILGYSTVLSCT
jgi:hypothetical protein